MSKTQNEEFNESTFQQKFLILKTEIGETRDVLHPFPDGLERRCEEVVKVLDITDVFLLVHAEFLLNILKEKYKITDVRSQALVKLQLKSMERLYLFTLE